MANDKHTTLGQMEDLAQRVQQMDAENDQDRASHTGNTTLHITATERTNWNDAYNKRHSHGSVSVSIPVSAWTANTDSTSQAAGYAYYADVTVSSMTASSETDTVLDMGSISAARTAGMAPIAVSMAGKIRFYSETVPESAISAVVHMTAAAS